MTDGMKKLKTDLQIAEAMLDEMDDYLRSDILFGRTRGNWPVFTLGGYLMRQHRLTELKPLLDEDEQARVQQMRMGFQSLVDENIVRSETKAQQEIDARLRQWREYIRDLRRDAEGNAYSYPTAVEARVMLEELIGMMSEYPYKLDPEYLERLEMLDNGLRSIWSLGDFVWPEEWETAYPIETYWYLYGGHIKLMRKQSE